MEFDVADLLALQIFADIDFVFEGEDDFADATALGGEHLFLDAADRQRASLHVSSPYRLAWAACCTALQNRHHRHACGWADLGVRQVVDPAGGDVDVEAVILEHFRIDAQRLGTRPDEALRGFRGLCSGPWEGIGPSKSRIATVGLFLWDPTKR